MPHFALAIVTIKAETLVGPSLGALSVVAAQGRHQSLPPVSAATAAIATTARIAIFSVSTVVVYLGVRIRGTLGDVDPLSKVAI